MVRFADIVVEVRKDSVRTTVDGMRLNDVSQDLVLDKLNRNLKLRANLPFQVFEAPAFGTGIGVYCRNADCVVVDLIVSKLD